MRAAAQPVALADRETLRCALRVALVKDRRDENLFNDLFYRYFRFATAVRRRTTVVILGDGRGNGNDPNLQAFEELARRCRRLIWGTPEPRYAWWLGAATCCYADLCDRVDVVRDLDGLDRAADEMVAGMVGR